MDFAFLVKHRLPSRRLYRPRPLYLADGVLSSWITHTTELRLKIGDHIEPLTFFITNLAKENPVILGLPWLRLHNPIVDWGSLRLTFQRQCRGRCLPHHIEEQEAPSAVKATPSPYQATVEEVEDEGEPDWEPNSEPEDSESNNRLSEAARQRRSRYKREWRQRQRLNEQRKRALTNGPRWTFAPLDLRPAERERRDDTERTTEQACACENGRRDSVTEAQTADCSTAADPDEAGKTEK
jgi:hypothetical protein